MENHEKPIHDETETKPTQFVPRVSETPSQDDEDVERKEYLGDSVTEAYRLKSELFSKSYAQLGMGRYQWEMFVVAGMGCEGSLLNDTPRERANRRQMAREQLDRARAFGGTRSDTTGIQSERCQLCDSCVSHPIPYLTMPGCTADSLRG